jgi:hypothetical protein
MENGMKIELNVGDTLDEFIDDIVLTRLKQAIRNLDLNDFEDRKAKVHLAFVLDYFGG